MRQQMVVTISIDDLAVNYGSYSFEGPHFRKGVWTADLYQLPDLSNGFVAAVPDAVCLLTGTVHGDVRLTVEVREAAPERELDEWEAAVEVSLFSTDGYLTGPDEDDFVTIRLTSAPGWYRLRAYARGRGTARHHHYTCDDNCSTCPIEEHKLIFWPAPPLAEEALKRDGVHSDLRDKRPLPAFGPEAHPVDLEGFHDALPNIII
ncbi:hypothetical protein [Micromonospora thermarum]|uniref:Uncharacterized protein n=1 Tax=Micromonospora thermarum TaxID=2720024 RepID=A0ABX0Z443_9ACTN|nr:hypothetical protein [Micromonospora thermarum]NJP31953.1 hypothetical protein [Micromonospora thermarum]